VRRQVLTDIEAGRSDAEITALLEARYGNSVLLTPPPGGLSDLLWLFPIALAIGIAAAVVAVVLRRRMPSAPKADHV
jgi:cytochrome c-type biogenesis protein CcmH